MGGLRYKAKELREIKELRRQGLTFTAIGARVGRAPSGIGRICKGVRIGTGTVLPELPQAPQRTRSAQTETSDTALLGAARAILSVAMDPDVKLTVLKTLLGTNTTTERNNSEQNRPDESAANLPRQHRAESNGATAGSYA